MREIVKRKIILYFRNWLHVAVSFPMGFVDIFLWFLRGRENVVVVKLFSRKFGHFLMNTESFLIDNREWMYPQKTLFFLDKLPYDNDQIKNIWTEILDFKPYGRMIAWRWLAGITSAVKYVDYPVTWTQTTEWLNDTEDSFFYSAVKKKKAFWDDLGLPSEYPIISITIRHSSYQMQAMSGSIQSWRDNDLAVVNKVIEALTSRGYQVVLANYISDEQIRKSLSKELVIRNWSLIQQAALFERSRFVLCGATGVDWIPIMQGLPAVLYNWQLGTSFPSNIVRSKSVLVPQKIFDVLSSKMLSVSEYSALLKKVEVENKIDRLESEIQLLHGVRTIHPSADEILEGVETIESWISHPSYITDDQIKKSWQHYPGRWMHLNRPWVAFSKDNLRTVLQS